MAHICVWLAVSHTGFLFTGTRTKLILADFHLGLMNDYVFDMLGQLYFGWTLDRPLQTVLFFWHAFKYTSWQKIVTPRVWLVTGILDAVVWIYAGAISGSLAQFALCTILYLACY